MKHEAGEGPGLPAKLGMARWWWPLPTCQPYSQDDNTGYWNFSSGFCQCRSRRYRARPWPSWEMPWKSSCRVLGDTCLILKSFGVVWPADTELLFGPPSLCLPWARGPGHLLSWRADPGPPWSLAVWSLLSVELVAGKDPTAGDKLKGARWSRFLGRGPLRYLWP